MPETVARISSSIYVDDIAYGGANDDQAYRLYLESKTAQVWRLQLTEICDKFSLSTEKDRSARNHTELPAL